MDQKRTLLIFPFNGNGLEALNCIDENYHFLGFVDDTPEKQGITPFGQRVYGREAFVNFPDALVLAVPGSADSYLTRSQVIKGLGLHDERYAKVVHSQSTISSMARIGNNVLIMAGVIVTSNAVIGAHTCILPNTVIHHDVQIAPWNLIGAGVIIAGNTVVEENCYIGSGTTIKNGLKIGSRALTGLGSNVVKNVEADARVAGNPARELKKKK